MSRTRTVWLCVLLFGCPESGTSDPTDAGFSDSGARLDASASPADSGVSLDGSTGNPAGRPGARQGHSATTLPDGRVLIAGGLGAEAQTEIWVYTPDAGGWARGPAMPEGRVGHSATLLADGRVLIAGGARYEGVRSAEVHATAFLFDPATLTTTTAGSLNAPRSGHFLFPIEAGPDAGKWLVIAGGTPTTPNFTLELFDPETLEFSVIPKVELPGRRGGASYDQLDDGRILIAGGAARAGFFDVLDTALIYDPADRSLTELPARMTRVRANHQTHRLSDGRLILIGGEDRGSMQLETEIFDPETELFSEGPALQVARRGHQVVSLEDGRAVVLGGAGEDGITNQVEVFTEAGGFVLDERTLQYPRAAFSASLLPNGRILVLGGQTSNGFLLQNFEFFEP